jgi:lysophospholipase L1-like esterase
MSLLALSMVIALATAEPLIIRADDPELQFIGRFADSGSSKDFDMPGCEIRVRLQLSAAAVVKVTLAQKDSPVPKDHSGNSANSHFQANSFVVWIDGVRQGAGGYNATFSTQALAKTEQPSDFDLTTSGTPLAAGQHDIRILKGTEAQHNGGTPTPNYVTFSGFKIGAVSMATTLTAQAIAPPPLPTRKIEFLGDSITAGFCNECKRPDPLSNNNEAYGATWDFQLGSILGAQVHTAAWSGLGMVRNCCGGNTTMPSIFSRTLATVNADQTWAWSSWTPDALVINLGTNDGGASTDPKYQYIEVYSQLIMEASTHYGPNLNVFLACGPMSTVSIYL